MQMSECFKFNLLLELLTVCGKKELMVFFLDDIMILSDVAFV